jgi:hypothetical protein
MQRDPQRPLLFEQSALLTQRKVLTDDLDDHPRVGSNVVMIAFSIDAEKLGQPVPLSNFVDDEKCSSALPRRRMSRGASRATTRS